MARTSGRPERSSPTPKWCSLPDVADSARHSEAEERSGSCSTVLPAVGDTRMTEAVGNTHTRPHKHDESATEGAVCQLKSWRLMGTRFKSAHIEETNKWLEKNELMMFDHGSAVSRTNTLPMPRSIRLFPVRRQISCDADTTDSATAEALPRTRASARPRLPFTPRTPRTLEPLQSGPNSSAASMVDETLKKGRETRQARRALAIA
ncbi:hypothetical protein T484DRAFT_1963049 [Baffinella frigidus]|nr:hypothetical protein T484DRAFT_1963049 [Cryptophyta sp. CCMP2293]